MRLALPMGVVALLTTAGPARATPSARLMYARSSDASSCPDEDALHKAVGARFGYDPFFAWAKKTVVVQIWRDHARYAARVQLVDDQGVLRGAREITSDEKGCADLFSAVALAISIALDASIDVPPPVDVPAPAAPPATDAVTATPRPAPSVRAPAPREFAPPAPAQPPAARPWLVGFDALGAIGVSKDPAPGLAVFATRRYGALSFAAEIQAEGSFPSSVRPAGRIQTALFIAALAPCVHFGPAFACAVGELGWQQAWSSEVTTSGAAGTAFAAAGGRLGLLVPAGSRFVVRFHADGLADLNPASYKLGGQDVFVAPAAALVLGVGAGVLFL